MLRTHAGKMGLYGEKNTICDHVRYVQTTYTDQITEIYVKILFLTELNSDPVKKLTGSPAMVEIQSGLMMFFDNKKISILVLSEPEFLAYFLYYVKQ